VGRLLLAKTPPLFYFSAAGYLSYWNQKQTDRYSRQLRELRSCELVAMDMGRLWKSEATEDVSHFLAVYGSILLIEK
jgi:hypothetical protein